MDDAKLRRLQALIARAGGAEDDEEARTSAWIACKMMREEGITPEQAMAPKALAAAPGWTPPPDRYQDRPARSARLGPDWDHGYRAPLMLPSEEMSERARIAEQQAQMREAQTIRAQQRLAVASKRMRELEEEKSRLERVAAERAREVRHLRGVRPPVAIFPVGAGRKERY
jgi:hypothetical protein